MAKPTGEWGLTREQKSDFLLKTFEQKIECQKTLNVSPPVQSTSLVH